LLGPPKKLPMGYLATAVRGQQGHFGGRFCNGYKRPAKGQMVASPSRQPQAARTQMLVKCTIRCTLYVCANPQEGEAEHRECITDRWSSESWRTDAAGGYQFSPGMGWGCGMHCVLSSIPPSTFIPQKRITLTQPSLYWNRKAVRAFLCGTSVGDYQPLELGLWAWGDWAQALRTDGVELRDRDEKTRNPQVPITTRHTMDSQKKRKRNCFSNLFLPLSSPLLPFTLLLAVLLHPETQSHPKLSE